MEPTKSNDDQALFETAIKSLEAQIANIGAHVTVDSGARLTYAREIGSMADRLRGDVAKGKLTWREAAQQAQRTRNLIMEVSRTRSTPVGRALAQWLKADGYSLNQMIARQTSKLYGDTKLFSRLPEAKQNAIYAEIVTSAGKSNLAVTRAMTRLSYAGRGLLYVSLGLSVYNIVTSNNKGLAIKKEITANGAGIAGGIAGGAMAGIACGPGAPVCVTMGAFVGGALAAFSTGLIW